MKPAWMIAGLIAAVAAPSAAAVLVADTGWQDDELSVAGEPTDKSVWTFTVSRSSILSVTDAFNDGDIFILSGDINAVTSFYAGNVTDIQAAGSFGPAWLNAAYSKVAVNVGPGTYSFSITGLGEGGIPAGLGVRLDMAAIPEPATWAMLIVGFGLVGAAARRRTASVANVTA